MAFLHFGDVIFNSQLAMSGSRALPGVTCLIVGKDSDGANLRAPLSAVCFHCA